MAKPIFAISHQGFMGSGEPNDHIDRYKGPTSLFGNVKRFYVHGTLEATLGYDICDFIAGDFLDEVQQDAVIVDHEGKLHEAVIIMVTALKTYNKYAFLVHKNKEEITKAFCQLWEGEWLSAGIEKY